MIENNVVINFTSRINVRELTDILPAILQVMGLSVLNREVVKLKVKHEPNEYQIIINTVVTEVEARAIRDVFKRFAFGIVWSDFDNLGDAE